MFLSEPQTSGYVRASAGAGAVAVPAICPEQTRDAEGGMSP